MWIWAVAMSLGGAQATEADPGWSELTPWRTWAVVENISSELAWFVFDDVPGPQGRCEAGVFTGAARLSPIVWCGPQARSDEGRVDVPKGLARTERTARRALIEFLAPYGDPLKDEVMSYLGTFRRVSLRQFVVVESDAEPDLRRAWGAVGHWDVDLVAGMDFLRGAEELEVVVKVEGQLMLKR